MTILRQPLTVLIAALLCMTMIDLNPAFALKDHTRDGWMVGILRFVH